MGYIGRGPVKSGAFRIIDDVSSSFNGSTTAFTLQHNSSNLTPGTEQNLLVAVDGVMQEPIDAFTISGSVLTFTSAPASGASFWGVELGDVGGIAANVANGAVDTAQLAADAVDGTKIADDVINSEHYVAASIDNEHLADDSVGADELAANAVVNASVASDAAIALTKLATTTASRLLVSDGSGVITPSSVTTANLTDLTDSGATTLHSHASASHGASSHTDIAKSYFISAMGAHIESGFTVVNAGRHHGLRSPDNTQSTCTFTGRVPDDFVSFTSIKVIWETPATSGNLVFQGYFYWAGEDEADSTNPETGNTVTVATGGAEVYTYTEMGDIAMNGIAAKDIFGCDFRFNRNSGSDTLGNHATIVGWEFNYVASQ